MAQQALAVAAPVGIAAFAIAAALGAVLFLTPVTTAGGAAPTDAELSSARAALQVASSSAQSLIPQVDDADAARLTAAVSACDADVLGESVVTIRLCESELLNLVAEVQRGL